MNHVRRLRKKHIRSVVKSLFNSMANQSCFTAVVLLLLCACPVNWCSICQYLCDIYLLPDVCSVHNNKGLIVCRLVNFARYWYQLFEIVLYVKHSVLKMMVALFCNIVHIFCFFCPGFHCCFPSSRCLLLLCASFVLLHVFFADAPFFSQPPFYLPLSIVAFYYPIFRVDGVFLYGCFNVQ